MTRTLFTGGAVFDGTGGDPAVADVVTENGQIVDVGIGLDGDAAVDCRGKTVLPGLFDCHVHMTVTRLDALEWMTAPFSLQFYEAARNMERTLALGITTVRDAGGADLGMKIAQERGLLRGPRLQISIRMISQTGGHGDTWEASGGCTTLFVDHPGRPGGVVDGPAGVRQKTREMVRAGADVIKIATTGGVFSPRDDPQHGHFRDDEVATIVREAEAAGLGVMTHAQGNAGIKTAIRGGVRSVEHGSYLDDEAITMMLDHGTWLVPTLAAGHGVAEAVSAGVRVPEEVIEKGRVVSEATTASIRAAIAAGVKIAMGTDAAVHPHGRNLRELELLVEHGMTPAQALHSATQSAAQLLGLGDELGTLEPGKQADVVIVEGDALDFTGLASRVGAVYQDGRLVAQ